MWMIENYTRFTSGVKLGKNCIFLASSSSSLSHYVTSPTSPTSLYLASYFFSTKHFFFRPLRPPLLLTSNFINLFCLFRLAPIYSLIYFQTQKFISLFSIFFAFAKPLALHFDTCWQMF